MSAPPRTALITGASSGIGAALARRLAADGVEVVLAARREGALGEVADAIRAAGGRARVAPLDVADPDSTAAAVRALDDEVGGLDLVVANAGVGGTRWSGALAWEDCGAILDVNVRGAVATLTAVLPRMVERRRGHLAGVTSMAGMRALPHSALYGASKAFLTRFLDAVRLDVAPVGVAVTEIRPGFVRTPMTDGLDSPKPFEVEPDDAAETIARGLARRAPLVAFPWRMARVIDGLRALPRPVFDRAARLVRPPTEPRQ